MNNVFTSESVSEGHPDKVCDFIADSILDAHMSGDPSSRVACEVLAKSGHLVLAGEITSQAHVDVEAVARDAIREIGYTDPAEDFHADRVSITNLLTAQSPEIGNSVSRATDNAQDQGAGDQGIMFGYAYRACFARCAKMSIERGIFSMLNRRRIWGLPRVPR